MPSRAKRKDEGAAPSERGASGDPHSNRRAKAPTEAATGARRTGYIAAAALAVTLLAHSSSIPNGFLANWDDDTYYVENAHIKDFSPAAIAKLFTVYYSANYHPLTALSNAIEYRLFGLNPRPLHAVNVALHLLNTFLVFRLVLALSAGVEAAGIVALFFGVHPMHVESVAWISERKDVLYAAFYLGSLLCYLRYLKDALRPKHLLAALALFLGSLLSKSAAVSLPVVLVAVDWYRGRALGRRALLEKLPFFVLSGVFGLVALWSQSSGGATRVPVLFTPLDRFLIPAYALSYYVVRFFLPVDLSAMHYFPAKVAARLPVEYFIAPFFLSGLVWLACAARRHRRELVFGLLFFGATIVLVSQVVPFGNAVVAERYTYLPYVGLLLIVATFYARGAAGTYGPRLARLKPAMLGTLAVAAVLASAATWSRNHVWESGVRLFTDAIEKDPGSFHAYYSRGCERQKLSDYPGAVADYSAAIRLNPTYVEAYNNRAYLHYELREFREAEADYTALVGLTPRDQKAYAGRGGARGMLGDFTGAIADYTAAIAIEPGFAAAYYNRAVAREKVGDLPGALADQTEAIRRQPGSAEAYCGRGNVKTMLGDHAGAIADYTAALARRPGYVDALVNRAVARYSSGDLDGAITDSTDAIGADARKAEPFYYRGVARLKRGEAAEACRDWERAAALGSAEATQASRQHCTPQAPPRS